MNTIYGKPFTQFLICYLQIRFVKITVVVVVVVVVVAAAAAAAKWTFPMLTVQQKVLCLSAACFGPPVHTVQKSVPQLILILDKW
jgi:hypothetical protein